MDLFWIGVYGIALFAASAFVSAIVHKRGRQPVLPSPGTVITLRSGGAALRCRFVGAKHHRWLVTPLTTIGSVTPSRTGDLLGLFGTPSGVVVFLTRVVGTEGPNVALAAPRDARVRDRRLSPRVRITPALQSTVDNVPAKLHNLGTRGALVTCKQGFPQGTEVVLQPGGTVARLTGFVLACDPLGEDYAIRILFDREAPLTFCWELATQAEQQ